MPDADYARVAEIARRLGVCPQTVRRHIDLGHIAGLDIGTRTRRFYRVSPAAIDAFTRERTTRTTEASRE